MFRKAFTMLELLFVIVAVGIMAKFGTELLFSSYKTFVSTGTGVRLQSETETTVIQIATRLQYRIKDSVIARNSAGANFRGINRANGSERILEWVGYDVDGWRGSWTAGANFPTYSGFIDLDNAGASPTTLVSPGVDFSRANSIISDLSYNGSSLADSAIYFIGSNLNVKTDFGWSGVALADQSFGMHPVNSTANDQLIPTVGTFAGQNVYEFYQLAWTAYAIVHEESTVNGVASGRLVLYYDYQPWLGETYTQGKSSVLMNHVDTFGVLALGETLRIQVCATDENIFKDGGYSVCKEKTIF